MIEKAQDYLDEFEQWLEASGASEEEANLQLGDADFYLNTYLPQMSAQTPEDGCRLVDDFFGYFFIHKCMWSTPEAIESTAASLKSFYTCMHERGRVSDQAYLDLVATFNESMDEWKAACEEYNDPSYSEGNPFSGLDELPEGLFGAVYDAVAQKLGFGDLLGVGSADDEYELPTRQEAINELTLALFYLCSWEEEPLKGSGITQRRAWKSADWNALDSLREDGLIDCTNKAKSVYLTNAGIQQAEETLIALGLEHLLDEDDVTDEDDGPSSDAREGSGWTVVK